MSNQNNNNAKIATIGRKVESEKIDHLLDKFFEIPTYQRLYEWEKDEIETLLDDMQKACDLDKEKAYFIGNITTSIKNNKGEHDKTNDKQDKIYVLIDGQQRLTTLWFIGFYLASKGCGEWKNFIIQGEKLRIAMPIRDNEEKALKDLANNIAGKENLAQSLLGNDIYQNIFNAFECIESWFNGNFSKDDNKKEIDSERLTCFANFIYTKICFVFVELAPTTNLNRFFVRMNNRGKQLEKHEILKARILSVIQQGGGEWQKYAKIWDLCSDMNKYIFQSAGDRNIFGDSKDKNDKKDNNKNKTETTEQANDKLVYLAEIADEYTIVKDNKKVKNNGTHSGAESIIDFPTFLLHCFKIFMIDSLPQNFTIGKDKLLEFIDIDKLTWNDKRCKEFIVFMLRIRVLFDYFVIKNTLSDDGFAIMRFYKNSNTYQPKANSLKNLAMIQNYLRVARQGDRQNYHHWLTPFLRFLDIKEMVNKEHLNFESNSWEPDEICENFIVNTTNDTNKQSDFENSSVEFLENLDTTLANKNDNEQSGELIKTTNAILAQMTSHYKETQLLKWTFLKDNKKWDFLKYGNAIRYWFYRLEYYLWKWGTLDKEDFETQCKEKFGNKFDVLKSMFSAELGTHNFKSIAKNFYFRNLNSVEHFHPQHLKKQNGWDTYINYFGNLALISGSINSQYSDQLPKEKKEDLKNKLNKKGGNTESLKFFLMCAQCEYDKDEWEYKKNVENKHEKYMLEILKESLSLNPNDSQNSSELQESK